MRQTEWRLIPDMRNDCRSVAPPLWEPKVTHIGGALPTNEEYFERWEAAAPTPVAGTLTPEEIKKHQDSRFRPGNWWESYEAELLSEDPALTAAIDEYASRVSDAKPTAETEDAYLERKEWNDKTAQQYQWVTPEEYADAKERIGRVMHSSTFIDLLQKAGVRCWYRQHPQPRKVTLVVQRGDLPAEVGCWVQIGFMPELSVMRFDDHGVPTTEKFRGWRTSLLQLVLKSVISEEKANETFGRPATTLAFHRYNATLFHFRSSGSRLAD